MVSWVTVPWFQKQKTNMSYRIGMSSLAIKEAWGTMWILKPCLEITSVKWFTSKWFSADCEGGKQCFSDRVVLRWRFILRLQELEGSKGHSQKGHREKHPENTWKYTENTLKIPWKHPDNTLKFMTFSTFSLCPVWVWPLHPSTQNIICIGILKLQRKLYYYSTISSFTADWALQGEAWDNAYSQTRAS